MIELSDIRPKENSSGKYINSWPEMSLVTQDGKTFLGRARRTGVTPPYFPDHPVYQFHPAYGAELPQGFFVWDGTRFTESQTWRDEHRAEAEANFQEARARKQRSMKQVKGASNV